MIPQRIPPSKWSSKMYCKKVQRSPTSSDYGPLKKHNHPQSILNPVWHWAKSPGAKVAVLFGGLYIIDDWQIAHWIYDGNIQIICEVYLASATFATRWIVVGLHRIRMHCMIKVSKVKACSCVWSICAIRSIREAR